MVCIGGEAAVACIGGTAAVVLLAVCARPLRSPFVCFQCYQTGLMSRYVKSWKAGDTAFWRGPFGGFFYKPNQVSAHTVSSGDPCSLASRTAVLVFQAV